MELAKHLNDLNFDFNQLLNLKKKAAQDIIDLILTDKDQNNIILSKKYFNLGIIKLVENKDKKVSLNIYTDKNNEIFISFFKPKKIKEDFPNQTSKFESISIHLNLLFYIYETQSILLSDKLNCFYKIHTDMYNKKNDISNLEMKIELKKLEKEKKCFNENRFNNVALIKNIINEEELDRLSLSRESLALGGTRFIFAENTNISLLIHTHKDVNEVIFSYKYNQTGIKNYKRSATIQYPFLENDKNKFKEEIKNIEEIFDTIPLLKKILIEKNKSFYDIILKIKLNSINFLKTCETIDKTKYTLALNEQKMLINKFEDLLKYKKCKIAGISKQQELNNKYFISYETKSNGIFFKKELIFNYRNKIHFKKLYNLNIVRNENNNIMNDNEIFNILGDESKLIPYNKIKYTFSKYFIKDNIINF
jgi:hypothetical protein